MLPSIWQTFVAKLTVMKLNCRLSFPKVCWTDPSQRISVASVYVFCASSSRVLFQLEQCVILNSTEMRTEMLWSSGKLLFVLTPWYQYKNEYRQENSGGTRPLKNEPLYNHLIAASSYVDKSQRALYLFGWSVHSGQFSLWHWSTNTVLLLQIS